MKRLIIAALFCAIALSTSAQVRSVGSSGDCVLCLKKAGGTMTGVILGPSGSNSAPSLAMREATTGFYSPATNFLAGTVSSNPQFAVGANLFRLVSTGQFGFSSGSPTGTALDTIMSRPAQGVFAITGAAADPAPVCARVQSGNGAYRDHCSISELLTLSTSGTTTDTTADLLPAGAVIESVVVRITTTIATATNWALGDPTTAARFAPANATLTAGTTSVGLTHVDIVGAGGPRQTAAAKVRITTTGTPSAGAIRITVFYNQYIAPTS